MNENRHGVLVHSAPQAVFPEIVAWGEASWWPRRSLMRFVRLTDGFVGAGTRYRQEVRLPFAPSWDAKVTAVTMTSITRTFLNGMFNGFETVSLRPQAEGTFVEYRMCYEIKGAANCVMWFLAFRYLHDANIRRILKNLKRFCERRDKK